MKPSVAILFSLSDGFVLAFFGRARQGIAGNFEGGRDLPREAPISPLYDATMLAFSIYSDETSRLPHISLTKPRT